MMKIQLGLIGLLITLTSLGQVYSRKELKYKPKNLNETLVQLDKWFADSTRTKIKAMTEQDFVAKSHFGLGMGIRNDWGLWKNNNDLAKYFDEIGVFHPDDMSGIILRSYHRKLNGADLKVAEQVDEIKLFYKNMNDPEWRKQQETNLWSELMKTYSIGDTLTNHIYYDRNKWNGTPRKNTILTAIVIDKRDREVKLDLISYGTETNFLEVFKEIECTQGDCWVNPKDWRRKKQE